MTKEKSVSRKKGSLRKNVYIDGPSMSDDESQSYIQYACAAATDCFHSRRDCFLRERHARVCRGKMGIEDEALPCTRILYKTRALARERESRGRKR